MNISHRLLIVVIAFSILFGGPLAASAASNDEGGTGTGFVTLFNREEGQHALLACAGDVVVRLLILEEGKVRPAGVPLGATCSEPNLVGFDRIILADPRGGGWYISGSPYLGGISMAFACTRGAGLHFVSVFPTKVVEYSTSGYCHPGAVPG